MSYQEKRKIATMFAGAAVLLAYCIHAWGSYRQGAAGLEDLAFWAAAMLTFIGIGIGAAIVIQILFHIFFAAGIAVKEREGGGEKIDRTIKASMVEDERDKLIELKSLRIGYTVSGAGVLAGLITLACHVPTAVMLHLTYFGCALGSLAEGAASLYYYRKGVKNA